MSPHISTALAGERLWLGTQLMVEASRRVMSRLPYPDNAYHLSAACDQASYCLDAPNTLPAGACRSFIFDDCDYLPAVVEQVVCEREA